MVWICWINQRCLEKYLHSLHLSLCKRDGLMNSSRSPSLKKYAFPIPKICRIYTHPPGPANTSCPQGTEKSRWGYDQDGYSMWICFTLPTSFKSFPCNVKEVRGLLFREKIKTVTCQTVAMQAVSVTELRNPCCSAVQAETPQPLRAGWRSVLSCATKLHCYDPADGGGHFPGNEVTDGH